MYILSQDKKTIINLDNIETITIGEPNDFSSYYEIWASYHNLGTYETEDRAKEILTDILDKSNFSSYYIMPEK